jgi:SAM-dependent methyltransferase
MSTHSIMELYLNLEKSCSKWSGYFDVYERHLNKFIGKSPRILEVGIQNGGSIELWLKYFGAGTKVIAVDIDEGCRRHRYNGNVEIIIGDQGDENFWSDLLSKQGKFDIVIDDGSHIMDHQIITMNRVFPHVNDGGVYICEDTHTSYWMQWGGSFRGSSTFLEHSKRVTDTINQQHFYAPAYRMHSTEMPLSSEFLEIYKNLYSVAFYNSMVVMEKEKLKPFGIVDNGQNIGLNLLRGDQ